MDINEANIKQILACIESIQCSDMSLLKGDEDLRSIGLNSLSSIELVVKLEEEFNISISDEDLIIDNVSTINNIEALLKKYCVDLLKA